MAGTKPSARVARFSRRVVRHLRCRLFGHYPDLLRPYRQNRGLDFATCMACRRDIVRDPGAQWLLPPRRMRVVWRTRAQG